MLKIVSEFVLEIVTEVGIEQTRLFQCAVFTARRSCASAVLGVVILSVCPSVTCVLCD